jgi:hypothetical protein
LLTPEKNVSYFETVEKMLPLPAELTVETIINYNFTLEQVRTRCHSGTR